MQIQLKSEWKNNMFVLPDKLKNFTPYEPLIGDYEIRLDVNESFIEIESEKIAQAVKNVKYNRYPDPYARGSVRAFAELFNINKEIVVAGNGSDELLFIITSSMLQKGDKVICLKPDFPMYSFYSKLSELDIIEIEKNKNMTFEIDELISIINSNKVKCLMFSNPCNPTSLGIVKSDVKHIVENCPSTLIILDEAYMDFWDESESFLGETSEYSNLIVLRTCSKSIALAGIRLGFAVSNMTITTALKAAKSPYNVNSISQCIGELVLSDKENYKKSVALIKKSVKALHDGVCELNMFKKVFDTKTNFILAETEKASEIYKELLNRSIAVRNFGKYLRICAGNDGENKKLLKVLQEIKGI